jgi:hypothetical protein
LNTISLQQRYENSLHCTVVMTANGSVTTKCVESGESCRRNKRFPGQSETRDGISFQNKIRRGKAVTTANHEVNPVSTRIQFFNQTCLQGLRRNYESSSQNNQHPSQRKVCFVVEKRWADIMKLLIRSPLEFFSHIPSLQQQKWETYLAGYWDPGVSWALTFPLSDNLAKLTNWGDYKKHILRFNMSTPWQDSTSTTVELPQVYVFKIFSACRNLTWSSRV